MTHKDLMVDMMCQLCGVDKTGVPQSRRADHRPVVIVTDADKNSNKSREKCKHCLQVGHCLDMACVLVCIQVDRNWILE